jgi:hypothetical protein
MLRALPVVALFALAAPASASDLPWLAGYWLDCNDKSVSESWIDAGSETLVGTGLTRSFTRTSFEFMRIAKDAEGKLTFYGSPSGAPAVAFPLKRQGASSVTFENPEHDFPQRVIYRREGDVLHARVEGRLNREIVGLDWTYKAAPLNAACPPR